MVEPSNKLDRTWTTYDELKAQRKSELEAYDDFFGIIELEEVDNDADINLGLFS